MLRESPWPGIEPTTCKSQVQRPTAEPPCNTVRQSQQENCQQASSIITLHNNSLKM